MKFFKVRLCMFAWINIGGSKGDASHPGSKFFHFHGVFGKKRLAPPPQENPGSATDRT